MKNPSFLARLGAFAATLSLVATLSASPVTVDEKLPAYSQTSGVSGNLNSIGSDTLNNLMTLWAEGFKAKYPNVNIQIEGKGSATAPPALIEGTAQLGPMSRPMKKEEIDKFTEKFGYAPTEVKVAIDALAVYVNKDNPVTELTLADLDGIFSSTRKSGSKDVATWGDLGLTGDFASRPVSLFGRNSASGTYGYFKEHALAKGDFKPTVKEQPGSSGVVQGISSDLYGIGYSGVGYVTSGVKSVPLGEEKGKTFGPSYENCLSGDYPLARFLVVYVNKAPGKPLDTLTLEFIKFVTSKEGQEIVVKDGYFPLPSQVASDAVAELTK
jgi:phosphate transport system substrate-binding protein